MLFLPANAVYLCTVYVIRKRYVLPLCILTSAILCSDVKYNHFTLLHF